ncbi:hypothetical protein JHW33_08585 [Rahnella aceris]|uniref:hypothetical protein n=1 Tax=Rahnella sp. (strain Y9602) TaxID=2703885 RepID=UPI0019075B6E|nr:hypothetical protein [Rahnella aceris]QQN36648.1 hypothetical protein JHW33_08585 [Rahnella aceris]
MPFFICAFYPKKSAAANGAVPVATCIDVKNAKLAEMKAVMLLEESVDGGSDSFFKPKVCELTAEINGRPSVGEFDSTWLECNVWNEETKTFDSIPTPATDDLSDPLASAKVIFDLPIRERIAYIMMYGAVPAELDAEQLSNAVDILADDETPEETSAIIDGLSVVPAIKDMYPEKVVTLIDTMHAQLPPFDNAEDVTKFAEKWVAKPEERNPVKTSADLPRTYDTLDLEVALHVLGVNPDEAKASDIRDAKHLKDNRDPAWRGWATSLRVVPGILDIPRGELWALMADGHKNLKLIEDADARRDYVSSKLHGHPLLPDYQPITTKVQNLGGGKFSIEDLAGAGASNEVEKTEVVEEQLTELQAHIRDLVTGKTNVASPDEMAKLLTEKNLGAKLVVKTLAKDYELSGNAFGFLKFDEIYDLTLDVVESWIPDQTDRIAFITERVKFYIDDRTNKGTVEKPVAETKPAETATIAPKTETVQEKTASETAKPASPENTVAAPQDDFRDRAEQIVGDIMKMPQAAQDNLNLWRQVHKTDERFTKAFTNNGGGTSINGTYMIMQATRVFGPQGINWGVDVLEERFDKGAPIMRSVKGMDGNFIKEVIPDGAGGYLTEINHTTKIALWYRVGEKRGEVISYGCTPYIQNTRNGVASDGEAPKKSLTDATKKALSQLGFSADVFLGLFDDQEYRAENKMQHELINASEKGEEVVRMRKELDEKFAANTETMKSAVTAHEVTKIASSLNRTIGVHLKNAKAVNDTEHARYLETRLRRLEEIKTECLKKFTEQGEKA